MSHFLLGMKLDATSYEAATKIIIEWARRGESHSVFAANVHMVMEAYDSHEFRNIINSADLVTSDGMPLVWWLRAKRVKNQQRVYGPDLMLRVCQSAANEHIPIGLYGSTQEVDTALVENLQFRFPGLQINFVQSPPFRSLSYEEDDAIVQQIVDSGIKILFIGLGCPKQELWVAEHKGRIRVVMIAVGAAFQFNAGLVRQASHWLQKSGLEWMFRLTQEPGRLWKRYFVVVPRFSFLVVMEALGLIHIQ